LYSDEFGGGWVMVRISRFIATIVALLMLLGAAIAAPSKSAVYCVKADHELRVFAGQVKPNGRLTFGISVWNPEGNHIGVFGSAKRHGDHWQYSAGMKAPAEEDQCKLDISMSQDGSVRVVADPIAKCGNWGGHGTEIGSLHFPNSALEGPVTTELRNSEEFFNTAGKCGR
jgi:hypothetical protein